MADRLLGSFVWCELLTTDTAAAESFYKKIVGMDPGAVRARRVLYGLQQLVRRRRQQA